MIDPRSDPTPASGPDGPREGRRPGSATPAPAVPPAGRDREATVPQEERGADGHAKAGRTTDQVPIDTSVVCDDLAAVRHHIGEALHAHDEDFILDVQLVATELASNACDHADDPRYLLLRREVHPDRGPELVVEARDATPDRDPVVGSSSVNATRGNGMKMVETICNDWGVRHEGDLKVVWGRIPIPR
ncbi:ATP-binding protein [Saccharothrix sp. Mg75]|uniref:ATP-binding protein n=1 Tax=Saccharothrix sp. Mg75 TaxID=3445357 RepID=UPI003EEBC8E2